jgi:hypothetical protein
MNKIRIILVALYAVVAGLVAFSGLIYPQVKEWSYWALATCALHFVVSLILSSARIATAARLASWCCQGISALFCGGFLLLFAHTQDAGWVFAVAATLGLNLIITLVLSLAMVPDLAPWAGKGFYDKGNVKR